MNDPAPLPGRSAAPFEMADDQTRVRYEVEYALRDHGVVSRVPMNEGGDLDAELDRWLTYFRKEKGPGSFNPVKRWRVCRTTYEAGRWTDA